MKKHAQVPKHQLCAEIPGIKTCFSEGVKMDEQPETDEYLLRVDNLSEVGEENLSMILKEMSNNMETLGESIKRLHEPESGLLGHESSDIVVESALRKRRKLSMEDTPGPKSGHCSDSEALLGVGKVQKITLPRMNF